MLQSNELKILFENFASLAVLQIIGYIFPLVILPYLSRIIGVPKFGILAFANVIISYVSTVVFFGFQYTAVRDISRNSQDKEQLNIIVSNVVFSMLFLLLSSVIVLLVLISSFKYFADYRLILVLTLLNIPAQIINFDWFFQGIQKMKYFTVLSFFSRLIYTVSIFFIIKSVDDYIFVPILLAISTFFTGLFAIYIIFIKYHVRIKFPGFRNIINTYKAGWSVFISQLAPNLYNSFSTIVLNSYYGNTSVGIYDAGRRVNAISEQLPIIFSKATFPYLSRRIDKHRLFMKINVAISAAITIVNLLFAEWIIRILYTPEFNDAVWVIRILAFTPLAFSLVNGYGINYLLQVGQERVFKNVVLISSILGFLLLFLLVPKFSFYGAASTVVLIYILQGFLCWYFAFRHQKITIND